MTPKVSVIVPNYNHAPFLKQRLDSIFNQTFQDFEVIILDDCSTDNSKDIIEQYRYNSKASHIVYNETNSGSPFKQWAKGFELAQGEYIWIAESDDWAEPNFLKTSVNNIEQNSSASLVFCDSIFEYQDHTDLNPAFHENKSILGKDFIKSYLFLTNCIYNASCVLFRKDSLLFHNKEFATYQALGDWLFWLSICEKGSVIYVKNPLNHFRMHNSNTTSKKISSGISNTENLQLYKYLKEKGYLTSFTDKFYITTRIFELCELKSVQNIDNKVADKMIQQWKSMISHISISHILCFSFVLFYRLLPQMSKIKFLRKYPFVIKFDYYSTLGILWNLFKLPNIRIRTQLKKIFKFK